MLSEKRVIVRILSGMFGMFEAPPVEGRSVTQEKQVPESLKRAGYGIQITCQSSMNDDRWSLSIARGTVNKSNANSQYVIGGPDSIVAKDPLTDAGGLEMALSTQRGDSCLE